MIEVLGEIVCFATASVSFVYGTLLGLFSGEKFYYKRNHRIDSKILKVRSVRNSGHHVMVRQPLAA